MVCGLFHPIQDQHSDSIVLQVGRLPLRPRHALPGHPLRRFHKLPRRLYLPAGSEITTLLGRVQFQADAMTGASRLLSVPPKVRTKVLWPGSLMAPDYLPDYTGFVSCPPMYTRWQNLSTSAGSVALILNLPRDVQQAGARAADC